MNKLEQLLMDSQYNKQETEFLVSGFRDGFDINYRGPVQRQDEADNIPLRIGSKQIYGTKLMAEVKQNRVAGPYDQPPYQNYIQSPIGLVPKANGKTRMIFHLSYEFKQNSVNAHIPEELCTVKYCDLDQAIKFSLKLGRKPVVYGKTDFSNTFRLVPLKPHCRAWLVMKAENPVTKKIQYFVDKCLPFGSSISCAIFQRFSNAVKHIFVFRTRKNGLIIWVVNYLDDFLFIQWKKLWCDQGMRVFLTICETICLPVAMEKTVWGTTRLVFLGILLDGENMILGIPEDKKLKAVNMLEVMVNQRKTTVKNVQRLAGFLNFLNRAIVPGRVFTRRMYGCLSGKIRTLKPFHHINVTREFKSDCKMWLTFLSQEHDSTIYRQWSTSQTKR